MCSVFYGDKHVPLMMAVDNYREFIQEKQP